MSMFANLMNIKASAVKEPPVFPDGTYRLIITGFVEGTNAKSGAKGIAFKVKPVESLEASDTNNPELAAEQTAKLEKFGDWAGKEFCFTYADKDTKETHLMGFCPINFLIADKDDAPHAAASFFYFRDQTSGVEKGFVHEVLGLSFSDDPTLGDIISACVNQEFIGTFVYEANKDPARKANLVLKTVGSV